MPFTYWDEDKNEEVTENMLIENGLQYDIVTSRANLPKGSSKSTYTTPSQYNFKSYTNINTQKEAKWDISGKSDTYTSSDSSYVKANNGVGVTVFPMRYSEGTAPFMSTGSEFKGTITSNFGGNYTGATMPSNAKFDGFYKDENGKIGFSVTMPSTVIEDELSDKKSQRNSLQKKLDGVKKDNPQIIRGGDLVDNPEIAKLEREIGFLDNDISELRTSKGQAQRLMVPLEDDNGEAINLSVLSVNGLPDTIEEINKIVGGRVVTKKKGDADNYNLN